MAEAFPKVQGYCPACRCESAIPRLVRVCDMRDCQLPGARCRDRPVDMAGRMTWTTDPNEHRLCLALLDSPDHTHRCGAPFGHGGPEHCCQVCGGWFRRDGGEATA